MKRSAWLLLFASLAAGAETSAIPIGLDGYRFWDQWPNQRVGMRAYMRSTYDRTGGNEGADSSHFLFQLSRDRNVTLDLEGPGLLVFSRFNHWHGSPWHYLVDGVDHVIQESSTSDPLHPVPDSVFLPSQAFPKPLNWTWATTRGADLIGTPVPFERSFRMAYERTHYGTGYYIYDRFVPGTRLSYPLRSWSETAPAKDVLDLIARSGTDIAPTTGCKREAGRLDLPVGSSVVVARLKGKAVLRALEFSVSQDQARAFENTRLRLTWDGRAKASVDAPMALFYGAGSLYNRDKREYLVKAFPVNIRFANDRIYFACYFPMPFFRSAKVELLAANRAVKGVEWSARSVPFRQRIDQSSYFHATYNDFPHPVLGQDLVLLNTRQAEGGGDWSGQLVGTSFIFSHDADLNTLEGDPRFFFDDSMTPQAQGTGTEEWAGGGDYWGGLNMTLPFVGHPVGARNPQVAQNDDDKIESAYRFLLADLMPFGKNAVIRLEHGGLNESTQHYESVTYWYGLPSASLVTTDQLKIGDRASETSHGYSSPQASPPYTLTSRYEWGISEIDGREQYPSQTVQGRVTKGTSEFRLRVRPDNLGVLLRRTLDYSFPNQRAEVYVAGNSKSTGKLAGIWYLAGSNVCVYSNPKEELGPAQHLVKTSELRLRDDEFLIPGNLTRGLSSIWVRIRFTPVDRPLFPGYPQQQQGWSEINYAAYSFVKPRFSPVAAFPAPTDRILDSEP